MKHRGRSYRIVVLLALLARALAAASQEKPLESADVEQLVNAGFGKEVIVAKIEQVEIAHFDLSTAALVEGEVKWTSRDSMNGPFRRIHFPLGLTVDFGR
jgi:hypothetical protein